MDRLRLGPSISLIPWLSHATRSVVAVLSIAAGLTALATVAGAQGGIISPKNASFSAIANTNGVTATFRVTNQDPNYTDSFSAFCGSGTLPVTCMTVSPSSFSLSYGSSTQITVSYNTAAPGNGSLQVFVRNNRNGYTDLSTNTVTVTPPPPPPVYSVAVNPKGDSTAVRAPNSSYYSESFGVRNMGTTAETYAIACGTSASVTCTGVSSSSLTLASGASGTVVAYYSVGGVGVGSLSVTATSAHASDGGSYYVPVRVLTAQAPALALDSVNPGALVPRDQCLTIAMGPAAGAECGDLRIVHSLPTTRTLGKARAPTLLYNSAFAHPHPVVRASVTLPANAAVPTRFDANLWNCATAGGCARLAAGSWSGTDWSPGRTRQIALSYDAQAQAQTTGLYTETIEIVAVYASTQFSVSQPLQVAVVDRRASALGAGWWIAGVEQLNVGSMVDVGGDGSLRQFAAVAGQSNVWVAPSVDFPDTLKLVGSYYVRYLPHRVQVGFNLTGQHVFTANRLSDTTWFTYDGAKISSIGLPPGGAGRTYQFAYPANQVVITAPGNAGSSRIDTLTLSGGRLTQIRDPDGFSTVFGYSTTVGELVVSRTDKLNHVVTYVYDGGQKAYSSTQTMGAGQQDIVRAVTAAETRGISGTPAVDSGVAYTRYLGPRNVGDSATFSVNRYGAPRRIVDALGGATRLIRGDARWPGLVTLSVSPNGRKQSATYDARGNLVSSTDSGTSRVGVFSTTQYQWDGSCDEVTHVVLPEGEVTDLLYDPQTCSRTWQQDGRGAASRVNFTYLTTGPAARRLATIKTPLVPATSITYDSAGNVRSVTSPRGIVALSYKDELGRDTLAVSPIDTTATQFQRVRTTYDAMDHVRTSMTLADNPNGTSADSLLVTSVFDAAGEVLSVARTAMPDIARVGTTTTQWRYDAAGRKIAEVAPDGYLDSTAYDLAGNSVARVTRRGATITTQYDVMNRVRQRLVPDIARLDTTANGWWFPYYAIPSLADTATYTYDISGNLLTAVNRDASIKRTYNLNGSVQTDTLKIRTYPALTAVGGDTTTHVYGLRHGYDLEGRAVYTIVPRQLGAHFSSAPSVIYDSTAFSFNAFGAIASARDVLGNVFRYSYDMESRLDTLFYPLGDFKHYVYNAGGSPLSIHEDLTATGRSAQNNDIQTIRDAREKIIQLNPNSKGLGWQPFQYTGIGALSSENHKSIVILGAGYRDDTDAYYSDALANVASTYHSHSYPRHGSPCNDYDVHGSGNGTKTYAAGAGRLLAATDQMGSEDRCVSGLYPPNYSGSNRSETHRYDREGNEYWWQLSARDSNTTRCDFNQCYYDYTNIVEERSAKYYDAEGHLRVVDTRGSSTLRPDPLYSTPPVFEEYRYDALGRRVLRRARGIGSADQIQRFVWDGTELVAEIQYPGADQLTTELERDTVTFQSGSYFGRVLYLPGESIDRPLSIVRIGYGASVGGTYAAWEPVAISPRWDIQNRGYDQATYGPTPACKTVGTATQCIAISWPALKAYGNTISMPTYAYLQYGGWWGSLAQDQTDATAQKYRRNRYYDPNAGRFTQEDPIGLAGGLNAYGYANGDPVMYSDPFGLWPFGTHNSIIDGALSNAGIIDRSLIKLGSLIVDLTTQAQGLSYLHSMRQEGQSIGVAKGMTAGFVIGATNAAEALQMGGQHAAAMLELGAAMHPVMDGTSPSHVDANGNPIVWKPSELPAHKKAESGSPTPEQQKEMGEKMRDMYRQVVTPGPE